MTSVARTLGARSRPKDASTYAMDQVSNETKNPRLTNITLLLRSMVCGVLGCLTCCSLCFGGCGKLRNHAGMVKYDDPEFLDMEPHAQRGIIAQEHLDAIVLCTPQGCISAWCCMGCCGTCGPRGVAETIKVVSGKSK